MAVTATGRALGVGADVSISRRGMGPSRAALVCWILAGPGLAWGQGGGDPLLDRRIQELGTDSDDWVRTAGDILMFALPASAYLATHVADDPGGRWQLVLSGATSFLATQSIKGIVDKTRPNGGRESFPSGHSASAFFGASFLERRYGWLWGAPAYGLAAFTAYSRVHAGVHDPQDVVAGAALSVLSTYIYTTPHRHGDTSVRLRPIFGRDIFGVQFVLGAWEGPAASEDGEEEPLPPRGEQAPTGSDPTRLLSRVDLSTRWLSTLQGDRYEVTPGGSVALGSSLFSLEMPFAHSDVEDLSGTGPGDLRLGWLLVPYSDVDAPRWAPRALGLGVDTVAPTGDAGSGSGGGAWIVEPRLVAAWTPVQGVNLFPRLSYRESVLRERSVDATRALSLEPRLEYRFSTGVYVYWAPEVDICLRGGGTTVDHRFQIGVPVVADLVAYLEWGLLDRDLVVTTAPDGRRLRNYDELLTVGVRYLFP